MRITLTVEKDGELYQSDEGENFDDIPELIKGVKRLINKSK